MDYQHAFLEAVSFMVGVIFEHGFTLIREYCSSDKCANFKKK